MTSPGDYMNTNTVMPGPLNSAAGGTALMGAGGDFVGGLIPATFTPTAALHGHGPPFLGAAPFIVSLLRESGNWILWLSTIGQLICTSHEFTTQKSQALFLPRKFFLCFI